MPMAVWNNKVLIWLMLAGAAVGAWLFFSPGTLAVALTTAALFYILNQNLKGYPQRSVIITICAIAIGVRFILAISNYYFSYAQGFGADLVGDARAYSGSGQYIAEVITNKPMPNIDGNEPRWHILLRDTHKLFDSDGELAISSGGYRIDYFARYIGWIYSFLGYDPIAVKLINSLFSVFTGILLFFLIKDLFSAAVAKLALILIIFWPTMLLWSVTGTKDSLTIFSIVLSVFAFLKLKKYMNLFEFLITMALLSAANSAICALFFGIICAVRMVKKIIFKQQVISAVIIPLFLILVLKTASDSLRLIRLHIFLPLLIAFCLTSVSFLNKKKLAYLLIIIFCSGLFLPFYLKGRNIDLKRYFIPLSQKAITTQTGQLLEARSGYRIFPDRFYDINYGGQPGNISLTELVISYFKGAGYALFSPFPWAINNRQGPAIYFYMILYYMLLPFIFLGIFVALRYRWRDALPLLVFMFIITSMYALLEGNVGTVFRHRDILMVFMLFFGAIGLGKTFNALESG